MKENYEDLLLSLTKQKTIFGLYSQCDGDAENEVEHVETDGQETEDKVSFEVMMHDTFVSDSAEIVSIYLKNLKVFGF